jgi:hypothetical protein
MTNEDRTTLNIAPDAGSRRGALAALLAGSALGLSVLAGASSPAGAAKSKKKQRGKNGGGGKGKGGNGGHGHGGKGHNGNGGNGNGNGGGVGNSLPSVRFVTTTTTFTNDGVAAAFSKCPSGYLPISGGFFTSAPLPQLLTSTPRLAENDWEIEINGANNGGQITVTAVCLSASDDTTAADAKDSAGTRRTRKRSRKR